MMLTMRVTLSLPLSCHRCRIKNCLDPAWVTTFETNFMFGKETRFNVGIYDEVRKTGKSISMGSALFEMGEVMGSRGSIKAKTLKGGGTVYVRVTKAAPIDYGTLHLQIRGIKLKNVDGFFSKSDPFFVLQSRELNDVGGRQWQPVHRSETIKNDLNPTWKDFSISMEKLCGGDKNHALQIEVYDWEKNGKHQDMGNISTSVNGLLNSVAMGLPQDPKKVPLTHAIKLLKNGKSYGNILVTKAYISGENLFATQPKTVGEIMNPGQANTQYSPGSPAPKKFIKINGISKINPEWKAWKAAQTPPPASAAASAPPPPNNQQPLPPPMSPPSLTPMAAPTATATSVKPSFVDYISGGTEISLAVAIDFTGSNGDPRKPGTLHYIHRDGQLNDYEKALTAVGSIVARYDSDQLFPVLGFGAKYNGIINHCFQVGNAKELKGVQGMLEGYRSVFRTGLTMSGPTVFADVIKYAASQAQAQQNTNRRIGKQAYTILLILTDGAVTDVEQTKRAIREASAAPLSIVIVGIGNADFSTMQFLDDFQQAEGGQTRDIVQFVEFSRHSHNKQTLTRETLDEIPDQLVGYFYGQGIMPLPPASGSKLNIFAEDYNAEEDIDLAVDVNAEGDITLAANAPGTSWDGQTYGTASNFSPPPTAPHPSFAPPAHSNYQPAASSYGLPNQAPQSMNGAPPGTYASTVPVVVPTVVHIQAPEGSYPGMQLRVQNPCTGQLQVVTIPTGVQPGAMFPVQL